MTAPILDKRITALENELVALRRRKLALLETQLKGMGVLSPEKPRSVNGFTKIATDALRKAAREVAAENERLGLPLIAIKTKPSSVTATSLKSRSFRSKRPQRPATPDQQKIP